MNFANLFRDIAPKLTADARRKFDHVANSPAVSELFAEAEAAHLKERKVTRAQLAAAATAAKEEQSKANAALAAAEKRVAAARAELEAAIGAHALAFGASMSASHRGDTASHVLIRQLEETADSRLVDLINCCRNLGLEIQSTANRLYPQRFEVYERYTAARKVAGGVMERCGQLRLEALTSDEVTAHLRTFVGQLTKALTAIGDGHLDNLAKDLAKVVE